MTSMQNLATATPSCSRTLSPSTPLMPSWRMRPVVGTGVTRVSAGLVSRHAAVATPAVHTLGTVGTGTLTTHNSILATAAVAEAGNASVKDGYFAAKQAAPPRGIPR